MRPAEVVRAGLEAMMSRCRCEKVRWEPLAKAVITE